MKLRAQQAMSGMQAAPSAGPSATSSVADEMGTTSATPTPSGLPPGIQMRMATGKGMPPGLAKKMPPPVEKPPAAPPPDPQLRNTELALATLAGALIGQSSVNGQSTITPATRPDLLTRFIDIDPMTASMMGMSAFA